MRVNKINERSVLLARQSSALAFKLFKFINANRSFGYLLCKVDKYVLLKPHYAYSSRWGGRAFFLYGSIPKINNGTGGLFRPCLITL